MRVLSAVSRHRVAWNLRHEKPWLLGVCTQRILPLGLAGGGSTSVSSQDNLHFLQLCLADPVLAERVFGPGQEIPIIVAGCALVGVSTICQEGLDTLRTASSSAMQPDVVGVVLSSALKSLQHNEKELNERRPIELQTDSYSRRSSRPPLVAIALLRCHVRMISTVPRCSVPRRLWPAKMRRPHFLRSFLFTT